MIISKYHLHVKGINQLYEEENLITAFFRDFSTLNNLGLATPKFMITITL